VEAAHIAWRPLGQLLAEQGLLTPSELEQALAQQQATGKRLGETIVELGFVSGPQLANALAAQYGIELTTEKGFGTGLRSEIQRRHEHDRRGGLQLVPPEAETPAEPEPVEIEPAPQQDLLPQLEEQWAKLAAAEAALAERDRALGQLAEANERLRAQIEELRQAAVRPVEPEGAVEQMRAIEPDSHLLFVQLDGRYALVPREGPPPLANAELSLPEVHEGTFVVAGKRPSPLPGDSRPCVVAVRSAV
jgi:hypothetical protein